MKFNSIHASYPEKKGFCLHRKTKDQTIFIHFLTSATIELRGSVVQLAPGACLFFAPHSEYVLSAPDGDLLHDWFHAEGDAAELFLQYGLEPETVYYPSPHDFITEMIAAIAAERKMGYPFSGRLCSLMGEQLIARLARFCTLQNHADLAPDVYRAMYEIRESLHTAFSEDWTVEKMALKTNLSPSYFHTLYKRMFGVTPKKDLNDIRLQHAKSLLMHSNLSITEIAERSGFGSDFHFIRAFKNAFGSSPNQYRLSQNK